MSGPDGPSRGALNQTAQLSPQSVDVLLSLPPLVAERSSVIEFHRACLAAFLEHGPRIASLHQVKWPARLVEALHERLARELGAEFATPQ